MSPTVSDEELARHARGRFRVERTPGGGVVLRWWWVSRKIVPWCLGTLSGAYLSWSDSSRAHSVVHAFASFPIVIFPIMTIVCAYVTAAYLVNRTHVVVEGGTLRVTHGPVPWPAGATMSLDDIAQVYVKKQVTGTTPKSRTIEYRVRAQTVRGRDVVLVNGPLLPDRARAIEDTLEALLRIEDAPVKGELGT
jgi:hypothetical protein